jgi:hypothetical protein
MYFVLSFQGRRDCNVCHQIGDHVDVAYCFENAFFAFLYKSTFVRNRNK